MLMNGILAEVIADRYNLMLYTVPDGQWDGRKQIDPRVDGMILVLPAPDEPLIERCASAKFPCVAIVTDPCPDPVMTVNADDFRGGYLATKHLIDLGHSQIMILHGGDTVCTNAPRMQGYLAALAECGLHPTDDMVVEAGFDWRPAVDAMEAVLKRPRSQWPTAIFAINDLCASGAIRAIKAAGLRVPEDFAIVGFDDTWLSTTIQPPLTTVRMPIKEMGHLAARMLADEIEGNRPSARHPVFEVTLTVRQSCGSLKGAPLSSLSES
jgi:LacI family transcriptional regulator